MKKLSLISALIFTFVYSPLSLADEIKDAISEALAHYNKGELSAAASQLDYASGLIRQQKAEEIKAVFPAALSGWEAEDIESQSAGAAMFGGGINASRSYYQGDSKSVTIELAMDSPMLQSMMAMFSNPAMITMSGGKLIKVQGQKAMLKTDGGSPEITLIINNRALFTIRGNEATLAEIKQYAEAINLNKLGK